MSEKRRWKSTLFNVGKIVVSVGMLTYILVVQVDFRALLNTLAQAVWGYLALAMVLAMGGVALRAVRWSALLRALDIRVPLERLVRLYFVGTFFNIFLLSGIGGDAIRAIELARYTQKTPEAIGTVLVDRATGLWVLFLMGLVALPFVAGSIPPQTALLVAGIALVVVAGGWAVMGTRLVPWLGSRVRLPGQDKLERFYHAVSGCGYRALGQACAISLIFNLINVTINYLIALGLNVRLPFGVVVAFAPVLSISLMLPSIGGLGVRETAHMLMYGSVAVSNTPATAISLVTFALQTLLPGLIGAVLYALEGALNLKSRQESE
jgi:uncharacterized membrane protein YbhN (UPF0104 family)